MGTLFDNTNCYTKGPSKNNFHHACCWTISGSMEYQLKLNETCMSFLHCISGFEGTFTCIACFTLAFKSADIFSQFR